MAKMNKVIHFALLVGILYVSMIVADYDQDEYIHLPGKSCIDAPPCPDKRTCIMAQPRCNVGTCPDLVPTCGHKQSKP